MTVKELYGMCFNLSPYSQFTLKSTREGTVAQGLYIKIAPLYCERDVLAFRIDDNRDVTVYLAG